MTGHDMEAASMTGKECYSMIEAVEKWRTHMDENGKQGRRPRKEK